MISVINLHHTDKQLPPDAVAVHRPNPLGNPFDRGEGDGHHNRDERVAKYKTWLWAGLKARDGRYSEIKRLAYRYRMTGELKLACWCAPHSCHADVIASAVLWLEPQLEELPFKYAGIGSRKLPEDLIHKITEFARNAPSQWTLSSGGAQGADQAFARGAGSRSEIHLPWPSFEQGKHPEGAVMYPQVDARAYPIAIPLHPNPAVLSRGAKTLTARNACILFDDDLSTPVRCVIYAMPGGKEPSGGTSNCLRVARAWNIPTLGISEDSDVDAIYNQMSTL